MKKLSFLFTVLVGGMCMLQSCDKDDDDDYQMSNQDFVAQASSSNRLEIMAGEMATTKGQSDVVIAYGQHMVTDHTMAEAELTALANTKGIAISQNLLAGHQSNLNILNQATPLQFDLRFAELMVLSHQEAVNLFAAASQPDGVPDPDLKAWAASKLPALQAHLQEAQSLYVQLGGR